MRIMFTRTIPTETNFNTNNQIKMTTEVVKVDPKEFGLDDKQAVTITKGLTQILSERQSLAEMYNDAIKMEITKENIPKFRELRLKIRDNRTKGIETWHRTNKEFYLRGGQFVDAIKRKEAAENERMEANLKENEEHFERIEQERLEKLQAERADLIRDFVEDADSINLSSMDKDVFEAYHTAKKKAYEDRVAAEKKAEEERIAKEKAEAEERERIRKENERLKAESEAREKAIAEERRKAEAKAEAERKKREAHAEKERKEREAKERAEQAAHEEQLRKACEAKAKVEAELEAKRKAEEDARKEAERKEKERLAAEKKAAKAPDKIKIKTAIDRMHMPEIELKTEDARETFEVITEKFEAFKKWASTQVESL